MILVTVGMQLGFDRLIEAMDDIAPTLGMPVIAQTGKGSYQPRHMEARVTIAPAEFESLVQQCQLIVSHAGIGTVLTAQRFAKPIVLFPRRLEFGEHRNDHQVATVKGLDGRSGVLIALEADDLRERIAQGLAITDVHAHPSKSAAALHRAVGDFIENGAL